MIMSQKLNDCHQYHDLGMEIVVENGVKLRKPRTEL